MRIRMKIQHAPSPQALRSEPRKVASETAQTKSFGPSQAASPIMASVIAAFIGVAKSTRSRCASEW